MLSDDLAKVALLGFNTSEFITFTFSVCVLDFFFVLSYRFVRSETKENAVISFKECCFGSIKIQFLILF